MTHTLAILYHPGGSLGPSIHASFFTRYRQWTLWSTQTNNYQYSKSTWERSPCPSAQCQLPGPSPGFILNKCLFQKIDLG